MSRPLRIDRLKGLLIAGLVLVGSQQLAGAALIKSKAALAQILIERAWEEALATGETIRPWPWADTWPVARISIPQRSVELTVLHGAQGNSLAFGPGHEVASAQPGTEGLAVFAGHRDTHFAFMSELAINDRLSLQTSDGRWHRYRISALRVIDAERVPTPGADAVTGLLLVTCFPFTALEAGGSLRYLAFAEPETSLVTALTIPPKKSYHL